MVVLDATIVNIALPHIQQALGFSTTDLSWVVNAYTLTFGGLLLLGGRAGDILGRRRVFIAGILLFTLASLLGGLATVRGLAARRPRPPGRRRRHRLADRAGADHHHLPRGPGAQPGLRGLRRRLRRPAARSACSPAACSTSWLSWRWVLFVNVPIGVLLAVAGPAVHHRVRAPPGHASTSPAPSPPPPAWPPWSTASSAPPRTAGATSTTVGSFAAAAVLLAVFFSIETRTSAADHPAAHVRATATGPAPTPSCCPWPRPCSACSSSSPCSCRTCSATARCRPASPSSPSPPRSSSSAQFAARSLPRFGPKPFMIAGALLAAVGLAWLTQISVTSGYVGGILGPMLVFGLGMGLLFVPLTLIAVSGVAPAGGRRRLRPAQRHASRSAARSACPSWSPSSARPAATRPPPRSPTSSAPAPPDAQAQFQQTGQLPAALGRPGPGPRHLDRLPARGRVRRPGPGGRAVRHPPPAAGNRTCGSWGSARRVVSCTLGRYPPGRFAGRVRGPASAGPLLFPAHHLLGFRMVPCRSASVSGSWHPGRIDGRNCLKNVTSRRARLRLRGSPGFTIPTGRPLSSVLMASTVRGPPGGGATSGMRTLDVRKCPGGPTRAAWSPVLADTPADDPVRSDRAAERRQRR